MELTYIPWCIQPRSCYGSPTASHTSQSLSFTEVSLYSVPLNPTHGEAYNKTIPIGVDEIETLTEICFLDRY